MRTKVLKVQHIQASERPANVSNSAPVEGGARGDFIYMSFQDMLLTNNDQCLAADFTFVYLILMETQS